MTIFAILVAGGVAFGMLALSVDVGNIMYERRQLQNGADATALSLAQSCAESANDPDVCVPANPAVEDLLDKNATDGLTQYDSRDDATEGACGRETDGALPDCTTVPDLENLRHCLPLPGWLADNESIPYVETYTRTESTEANPSLLPRYFSRLIAGEEGDASMTACSRAAWGAPASHTGAVPIVISACEWQRQTSGGTDYVSEQPTGAKPGYGGAGQPAWPGVAREIVVILHDPNDEGSDCDWNGKDTAGGFGFVDSAGCSAIVSEDDWVQIDPGASAPHDCSAILPGLVGTAISMPVFNCLINSHITPTGDIPTSPPGVCDPTTRATGGAKSWYHVAGWARFYLSGYKFPPGGGVSSVMPGGHSACASPGAKCLFGWFLTGQLDATAIDPDPDTDFGTYTVLPAG